MEENKEELPWWVENHPIVLKQNKQNKDFGFQKYNFEE